MSFAPKKEVWDATHERDAGVVDRAPGTASTSQRAATKGVPPLPRVEPSSSFADDESSEWLSEWGEAPRGAHETDRPGWRGGGKAPNRVPSKTHAKASRPLPVAVVPPGSSPSVGVAAVEAALRGWLTRNRALHEPKRITLIKMLGTGLVDEPRDERAEDATEAGADRENGDDGENGENVVRKRQTRFVNGIPLDANGRPVGVLATFPDPRYAAVDREGCALPLEARREFIPKPMPPAKRAYHPQAAPFGPKRRDGVWDGPEENPRDTDPRDPDEAARDKGLMPKAPPLVLTQAQFRRACAKSGVGAVSEADARELFARRSTRPGGKVLEIEAFADAVLLAPQRGLGIAASATASARTPSDSAGNPGSSRDFVGKITYAPCRVGVFAPSDWDADKERVSEKPPDVRVELRWAHGCSVAGVGHLLANASPSEASASFSAVESSAAGQPDSRTVGVGLERGRWAYAVGAMGVVYDGANETQTFFRGHDDEIVSLATHPSGKWAATGQAGRAPCVCVWDTATGKEVARLRHAPGDRGVVAVAFGPGEGAPGDGDFFAAAPARLVTVAADATHCVRVWDWGGRLARRGRAYELSRAPGRGGGVSSLKAPRVRGAAFAPDADAFATFGEGHVKIWKPRARDAANDTTATGARPQGAAAAAAAEAARARAAARAAALPGGAATFSLGYVAKTCGGEASISISRKEKASLPDATCGAFAPGPGGGVAGLLVTGHADGRIRIWHGDALVCVSGADAHGAGEPVRALAISPPASAGRTVIVTGAGDGVARRWGVFAPSGEAAGTRDVSLPGGTARLEIRRLGELPVPREAPPGFAGAGAAPTVRALATDAAGTVAAVTAAGDLWIAADSVAEEASDAAEEASASDAFRMENEMSSRSSRSSRVFACVTRGQPSAAHCVAWHPFDARGVFAVAGGGARVCVYAASSQKCVATVWATDPTPARVTSLAFAPDPAPEAFPEAEDTEDRGALMLALGTADGQVRLVRLRLAAEEFSDVPLGKTKTKTYVARAVAAAASSSKRQPVTSLCFSPDGARLAAAADKTLAVHAVVGAISRAGARRTEWLPSRVACRGHRGAIVSADWSKDGSAVRTTCRAREILHFDARSGRQAVGDFRDAEWATWTAPLGFPVMGVFQNGGAGGDEINSVSRCDVSPNDAPSRDGSADSAETVVAAGDDFGRVRVFRWPCVAREAPAVEEIETHASHVSCVRFAPEGVASVPGDVPGDKSRWLVSAGGADRAALQWALVSVPDERTKRGASSAPLPDDVETSSLSRDGVSENEEDEEASVENVEKSRDAVREPPKPSTIAYRRDALENLETRVSSLLSAARPRPPARRARPWTKKPSIEVRARDAGRIQLGPRRPDTPPDIGEVLEYVDGEYAWVEPTKLNRPS